ncbi:MAG: 4Fe-4S dicluster domain-containing protein [Bacteroidales bacterium]|nr:4Fe-4S dicluster domain-containing protein [Bacteroidales bacterium]
MDNSKRKNNLARRTFLRSALLTSAAAGFATAGVVVSRTGKQGDTPLGEDTIREIAEPETIAVDEQSDVLIRMQKELRKALKKPVEQRKWIMVIDTRKCVGCHACTVACIAENKLPPGVVYRPVVQEEFGKYPNVQLRFFPRPCMQCESPSCTAVCPVKATWKREDGITAIDYEKCIGCRYCLTACPYGARTSDFGEFYTKETPELQPYELLPNNEYGKAWDRSLGHSSPMGNARKCHFCLHRIDEGLLPQCVTTCIGRATFFGDANDSESLVSELSRLPNQIKLLEEKGTKPKVIYLI